MDGLGKYKKKKIALTDSLLRSQFNAMIKIELRNFDFAIHFFFCRAELLFGI